MQAIHASSTPPTPAVELQFAHCILPVTPAIAKLWGRLCVQTGNKGIDNLIAATALCHNLTVVTRNVKGFEPTGCGCLIRLLRWKREHCLERLAQGGF
jgi:hypothetical protein